MADVSHERSTHTPTADISNRRRADIQGMRALAVLAVVLFHAGWPVPGGFVGVDVFFVISGFVITSMLRRQWLSTGRVSLGSFYVRRFRRLTPALALVVTVTLLLSALFLSPLGTQEDAALTGVGAMLLVANYVILRTSGGYFDAPAETNPLLNTWSLSVEEQFYLGFPLLLIAAWLLAKKGPRSYLPLLAVSAVAAVSFALALMNAVGVQFNGSESLFGFYSPFARAWEFAAGAVIALTPAVRHVTGRAASATAIIGLLLLAVSLFAISDTAAFPGPWTLLPVVATVLLIASGSDPNNPVSRGLSNRWALALGDLSYSWYLWHWPLIVFAWMLWPESWFAPTCAAAVALLPALASYHWVEQPIRHGSYSTPQLRRIAVVTFAVPLLTAGGLWFASTNSWWSEEVRLTRDSRVPTIGQTRGCDSTDSSNLTREECRWNPEATGSPIYLLGDSNAGHYGEALLAAAQELDRPLVISTTRACPFISTTFENLRTSFDNAACTRYTQESLATLADLPPGTVVISHTDSYLRSQDYALAEPPAEPSIDPSTKATAYQEGLIRTVEALQAGGHEVLMIQPTPKWDVGGVMPLWDPLACTTVAIISGTCDAQAPVASVLEDQAAIRNLTSEAASRTGSKLWDPLVQLCPSGQCGVVAPGGHLRYGDPRHISVPQSVELGPTLTGELK